MLPAAMFASSPSASRASSSDVAAGSLPSIVAATAMANAGVHSRVTSPFHAPRMLTRAERRSPPSCAAWVQGAMSPPTSVGHIVSIV
jgi:hypothetical protein